MIHVCLYCSCEAVSQVLNIEVTIRCCLSIAQFEVNSQLVLDSLAVPIILSSLEIVCERVVVRDRLAMKMWLEYFVDFCFELFFDLFQCGMDDVFQDPFGRNYVCNIADNFLDCGDSGLKNSVHPVRELKLPMACTVG